MMLPRSTSALRQIPAWLRDYSTTITKPKTGIVLVNMGGPENTDQVHDYLKRIMTDTDMIQLPIAQNKLGPWIAKRRTPEVQKKYKEIGGGSPILKWTKLQGKLLCDKLDECCPESAPHKPYVAFRYVPPFSEDAFTEIERDGVEHTVIFSQYPQYSCATTGSSFNEIYRYLKKKGISNGMKLSIIDRWPINSLLAKCFAENIKKELNKIPESKRKQAIILFSAHSLPLKAVNRGDPYPSEVGATVHQVMKELDLPQPYQLVWQSKVGPLKWLGPMTDEAIGDYVKQGRKTFIVVPIAFVNEHIETLHELDIEYCQDLAKKIGVEIIHRVPAPNDHPLFIEALYDIVKKHLKEKIPVSSKFLNRCPHCVNPNCAISKKWYSEVCSF
ncbi:ferrochelatase, mitochondrial [Diorhabda sublineata]|uniref:ferrochelatase, mitochondrial n=1 Tax=Diorhabda sublineata TaxID=1163346 RepID=UPI0024E06309|nr:ferrochelatase, mitochondrial [Diorhabda sublineata]